MKNRIAENIIWAMSAIMIVIFVIVFVLVSDPEFIIPGIEFGVILLIMLCNHCHGTFVHMPSDLVRSADAHCDGTIFM